jgi:hypothetical protein
MPRHATPDRPIPFGYKMTWYAVRSTDPSAVARAIGLRDAHAASWERGIASAYGSDVFVAPPVRGWVLIAGFELGPTWGTKTPSWKELIALSSAFGEAQAFSTHRVVDMHVWAKAIDGDLVRARGYLGDGGETLFDVGEETPEERDLGFKFFDEHSPEAANEEYWERTDLTSPDEESVMSIARRWSLAPVDLDESSAEPMTGLVGRLL